jgi:hypothetical protein
MIGLEYRRRTSWLLRIFWDDLESALFPLLNMAVNLGMNVARRCLRSPWNPYVFGTGAWYEPPNSDEDPVLNLPWMVVPSLETKSWMV